MASNRRWTYSIRRVNLRTRRASVTTHNGLTLRGARRILRKLASERGPWRFNPVVYGIVRVNT